MERNEGSSQTIMASKNDKLNIDTKQERNGDEVSSESILKSYAGRLYDRVDMACHINQCDQITYLVRFS